MILSKITSGVDCSLSFSADCEIDQLIYDSRTLPTGNALFVCLKGFSFDGHDYAKEMYNKGVRYFAAEHALLLPDDARVITAPNTRIFLASASANFFGNPSEKLFTVAITGTKGKSSTSFMIKNIFEKSGKKTGVIGTTGIYYNNTRFPTENSTPESYLIHYHMAEMLKCGCDSVVMETSSQGFKMYRTYGIMFDIGVFTNLSNDHIGPNEHKDFEEYMECKKALFGQCKEGIFNLDDPHCNAMMQAAGCKCVTFGRNTNSNYIIANDSYYSDTGKLYSEYTLNNDNNSYSFKLPLLGEISVYNSACAAAVAFNCKIKYNDISQGLCMTRVIGRNEIVAVPADFSVIIDYAHNEVSVKSVFTTLSHYSAGRIISVFGCGGNRSRLRRFAMGEIISANSDITVITSDNPRFEKLEDIIEDISSGIKAPKGEVHIIKNRREAIYFALSHAEKNDIVLLLGKGDQDYEEIEGIKHPFDERKVVADYFTDASR